MAEFKHGECRPDLEGYSAELFFAKAGREVKGLEPKPEHFTKLVDGEDFDIEINNDRITSARHVEDFFIFVSPNGVDKDLHTDDVLAGDNVEERMVRPPHWRSVSTEDVETKLFRVDQGKRVLRDIYYEVNTKGVGFLKPSVTGETLNAYTCWASNEQMPGSEYKVLGLSTLGEFSTSKAGDIRIITTFLASQGLRCEVYWAIAKLHNIIHGGKKKTIAELQDTGVIPKDFTPYMGVRVMKNNDRIGETKDPQRQRELFAKAMVVFNKETADKQWSENLPDVNMDKPETHPIFFHEIAYRLGQNVCILQNLGMTHHFLHSGNITLAAEFADMGSVYHHTEDNDPKWNTSEGGIRLGHLKDMRDTAYSLKEMLKSARQIGLNIGTREEIANEFVAGYKSVLNPDSMREAGGTDPVIAQRWMEQMARTVFVEGKRLPSLTHHQLSSWGIKA